MSSGILCRSVPLFWQEMGLWKLQSVLRGGSLLNPPYFSPSWLYAQVDCNNVGESISGSFRIGTLTEVLAGEALGDLFALASAAKGWRCGNDYRGTFRHGCSFNWGSGIGVGIAQ